MKVKINIEISMKDLTTLNDCNVCPRNCGVNRNSGKVGLCKSGATIKVEEVNNKGISLGVKNITDKDIKQVIFRKKED